jgi:uncharacterized protein
MYDVSMPVIAHGLKALDALVKKAEAHCEAKKINPDAILTFRLFPDMFPFINQVQLVTDFSKGCAARLSGQAVPSYADTEKTFAELHARIAKTLEFVGSVDKSAFADAAKRQVTIRVGRNEEKTMSGEEYFNRFVLPNFYFHLTTAYNILRHNGVELGKNDFMGRSL